MDPHIIEEGLELFHIEELALNSDRLELGDCLAPFCVLQGINSEWKGGRMLINEGVESCWCAMCTSVSHDFEIGDLKSICLFYIQILKITECGACFQKTRGTILTYFVRDFPCRHILC